jgi:protein-arginine kinase activator protein McsA
MGEYRGRTYKCFPETETIIFNGREYHRNPGAIQKHRQRYFWGRRELGDKKKIALHVAVWEHHNGHVPEGMVIHHKDGDPRNNDISNLACISLSMHGTLHNTGRNLDGARHSKMYRHTCQQCGATYESFRKKRTRFCSLECQHQNSNDRRASAARKHQHKCQKCGAMYETFRKTRTKFCSRKCQQQDRNDRVAAATREARRVQLERG